MRYEYMTYRVADDDIAQSKSSRTLFRLENVMKRDPVYFGDSFDKASRVAQEIGGIVVENSYEFYDSELVADFTDIEDQDE